MNRTLTCIICPRGCTLTAEGDGKNLTVKGNSCPKGEQYAINECVHPTRTVTSTVRVKNREDVMVSVKTSVPIPKENIFDVMEHIRKADVNAPINIGDIILSDLYGCNVIATKNII